MTTYQEYKAKIAELSGLADEAFRTERKKAKDDIAAIMREFNLTLADLGSIGKSRPSKEKAPVPIKYRDKATGKTWTGRGRAPKWLEGKNKDDYLLK